MATGKGPPQAKFKTNLPPEATSFIGRNLELAYALRLLEAQRLVTITGTAGCGKTRLAMRLAADKAPQLADGAHWIALAPLTDGGLIAQTIARALGVPEVAQRLPLERLVDALKDQQILLVLDNCEHLRSDCAWLVERLLAETSATFLVTSREALQIQGETLYSLQPLAVPPPAAHMGEIAQSDAVILFAERTRARLPNFNLTEQNADAVASICQKLDGIPLAIELASARTNILSVAQISDRLDRALGLLTSAEHLTSTPHASLRAAIDWSYDLLTPDEQRLLQCLSVFRGGCSLAVIERVCTGVGLESHQLIDLLASLVSKSLVNAQTLGVSEARYSLLEIIREYGQEKLLQSGDWEALHQRHLEAFLGLVEETEPKLLGPYQELWLNLLEREFDNIRAALEWAWQTRQIETGLRIANAIYQLWTIRDFTEEGHAWFERLLETNSEGIAALPHSQAISYAANLSGFRGEIKKQIAYGRRAAQIAQAAGEGEKQVLIWALSAQAFGARGEGDFDTEFRLARRAIDLNRELGNTYLLAVGLSTTSFSAMSVGQYAAARALLDEAIPLLRDMGNPYRIAMALNFSGDLARCEKNYPLARVVYEESISILRTINAGRDLASVLHNLGHVCLHLDQIETGRALFIESLATHRAQGNQAGMAECLIGFAALAIRQGEARLGVRLLAAVTALRRQPVSALWAATRSEYEQYMAQAKLQLTAQESEMEGAIGRSLSLEQAVMSAEKAVEVRPVVPSPSIRQHPLTRRELDVVHLIAMAKTNDEIAAQLVLSKRTVEKHIANIRSKLDISERAEILLWAIDQGLVSSDERGGHSAP